MLGRALLALLVVAGCNRAFGLRRDHDVEDVDASVDAALHDEDHDGVADGDDLCPADLGGGNTDGDQAGNLCDPSDLSSEQRVLFDPFTEIGPWTGSVPWTFDGDAVAVDATIGTARLDRQIAPITYPTFETTVTGPFTMNSYVGAGFTVGDIEIGCYLHVGSGTIGTLEIWYDQTLEVFTSWPPADAPVHLTLTQLGDKTFRCRARRDGEAPIEKLYALVKDATTTELHLHALGAKVNATSVVLWRTN